MLEQPAPTTTVATWAERFIESRIDVDNNTTPRNILDYIGIDPNPARNSRVTMPREEATIVDPPSGQNVDTIIEFSPPRWRLALRTLEQTGIRVGRQPRSSGRTWTSRDPACA
jgi:hypothetical protein